MTKCKQCGKEFENRAGNFCSEDCKIIYFDKKLIELKATALVYKPYEIDDIIETIHKVKMVL